MIALAMVDHVENLIRVPGLDAILDGRQVSGGVVEGTVSLADDEGCLGLLDVDDDRSFALDGEPLGLQIGHDRGQHRVVKALAELHVEPDAQAIVKGLKRPGSAA